MKNENPDGAGLLEIQSLPPHWLKLVSCGKMVTGKVTILPFYYVSLNRVKKRIFKLNTLNMRLIINHPILKINSFKV